MSRNKTPDSISHKGVNLCILLKKEQKQMLKELAEKEDCSMNRIIRILINKEYDSTIEKNIINL